MKYYAPILLALSLVACSTKQETRPVVSHEDDYDFDGITLSRSKVKDAWLTTLSEKNPQLYVEVAKAMIISRDMGRTIYVHKESLNGRAFYSASFEDGGGKNVIVADYPSKEILFDHFNDSDGESLLDTANKLWIDKKVQGINKEIRAGDYK